MQLEWLTCNTRIPQKFESKILDAQINFYGISNFAGIYK
jgi:hypothetical protein